MGSILTSQWSLSALDIFHGAFAAGVSRRQQRRTCEEPVRKASRSMEATLIIIGFRGVYGGKYPTDTRALDGSSTTFA